MGTALMHPLLKAPAVQVPQLAAMHHNDCQHVAQWLQQAPYCHEPLLSSTLGHKPAWLGAVAQLHAAAQSALDGMVSLHVCCPAVRSSSVHQLCR